MATTCHFRLLALCGLFSLSSSYNLRVPAPALPTKPQHLWTRELAEVLQYAPRPQHLVTAETPAAPSPAHSTHRTRGCGAFSGRLARPTRRRHGPAIKPPSRAALISLGRFARLDPQCNQQSPTAPTPTPCQVPSRRRAREDEAGLGARPPRPRRPEPPRRLRLHHPPGRGRQAGGLLGHGLGVRCGRAAPRCGRGHAADVWRGGGVLWRRGKGRRRTQASTRAPPHKRPKRRETHTAPPFSPL